jgi:hypothetical protein
MERPEKLRFSLCEEFEDEEWKRAVIQNAAQPLRELLAAYLGVPWKCRGGRK